MYKNCAYCDNCIHISGDEGDEWYCKLDQVSIDDPYFDGCKIYKKKEEE